MATPNAYRSPNFFRAWYERAVKRTIPAVFALSLAACRHFAVGDPVAPWVDGYANNRTFTPRLGAVREGRIRALPDHVQVVYSGDARRLVDCSELGLVHVGSLGAGRAVAARVGATHIIETASEEYVAGYVVTQLAVAARRRTALTFAAFRCD